MNIDLKEYKAALEELTRNLGYGTVYFKPDLKKLDTHFRFVLLNIKKNMLTFRRTPI